MIDEVQAGSAAELDSSTGLLFTLPSSIFHGRCFGRDAGGGGEPQVGVRSRWRS